MKRREFIKLFGRAAAVCVPPSPLFWPFAARAQSPAGSNRPAAAAASQTGPVGQVATVQGTATVTRGSGAAATPLQVNDPIFKNDALATGIDSALGVTFDDETTFSLSANTRILVNEFVYQEGGTANAASFNVAVGTAAFVASLVAKTGDMKITTPTATLGIRGTTGVVDVPQGGAGGAGDAGGEEPRIKLYPDTDGHVGQIEVFNPRGERLGALTQGGSAFAIQRDPGGSFRAVPFRIPPQEAARDRGVLQRLFASHAIGRRMTNERIRSRGGGRLGPRQPGRFQQPSNQNPRGGGPPRPQPRRGGPGERGKRQ
jgi:FecR protein